MGCCCSSASPEARNQDDKKQSQSLTSKNIDTPQQQPAVIIFRGGRDVAAATRCSSSEEATLPFPSFISVGPSCASSYGGGGIPGNDDDSHDNSIPGSVGHPQLLHSANNRFNESRGESMRSLSGPPSVASTTAYPTTPSAAVAAASRVSRTSGENVLASFASDNASADDGGSNPLLSQNDSSGLI